MTGFPGRTSSKEPSCRCRRHERRGFGPRVRKSPGGGRGNPLQRSCLENPMARGAWWAVVLRATKSWTQLKWLSTHTEKDDKSLINQYQDSHVTGRALKAQEVKGSIEGPGGGVSFYQCFHGSRHCLGDKDGFPLNRQGQRKRGAFWYRETGQPGTRRKGARPSVPQGD